MYKMVTQVMWKLNVAMIDYTKIVDKNHKNDYNKNKNVRANILCVSIFITSSSESWVSAFLDDGFEVLVDGGDCEEDACVWSHAAAEVSKNS